MDHLQQAAKDIRIVQQAVSQTARAFATNRALGSLSLILDTPETLPEDERQLILTIAQSWQTLLLKVVGEVGNQTITQPIQIPYTIGDPVIGDRFIGRDDIMRQLEELWFMNPLPQSIVLYGHRRMGKTSILRNITTRLGAQTRLAYINLQLCETATSIGEVLITLTDKIAKTTTRQLLANPSPDFPLDFTEDLYTAAHQLTNGQPYLIQLLGFQLTRRYNTQVFEQNRPREPRLTIEDLNAIVNGPELYSKGRYYFTGVWQQAAALIPEQQPILQYLADYVQGKPLSTIAQGTNISEPIVQSALDLLKCHDVAENENGHWKISIELFRRWILQENLNRD